MSIARVIAVEDQQVLDLLREYGLEERAREYEALLRGELPFRPQPDPLPEPVPGAVPIAAAATRLGISRKEIRREIEIGLLKTESDSSTGELLVTNASIEDRLDWQRRLAIISRPLPGDVDDPLDPNSLLGRMFAEADEPWEDDEEV